MATSASPLPSGPLRFATSTADSSRPHTFALRYPSSHPAGLSNAGASLSSTASGDVSLRQGASEPCGRRWAGQPTKTTDIECAVVWDENQHCWILHRLDNIVHLRNDDPGPLQKKPTAKLTTQLALPKPALSAPPPPKYPRVVRPSQPRHNSSDASTSSSSNITRSQDRDHNNRTRYTDDRSNRSTTTTATTTNTNTTSPQVNLVLPTKKRDYSAYSSQNPQTHNPPAHRPFNQSNLITTSPASDTGPLRVAQAEEVEEFDFDSPADPDPPPQPDLGAPSPLSPLKLPSPASHQPPAHSYPARPHLGNLAPAATSPAGRPTLSRSPSVADNGASSASLARPNANPPLILPSRPSNSRPKAVSPAYPYNGLPRSANLSNQPTAPSPLASIAYSSSSSPEDRVPTATTPALVSVSPASVTVTTTESVPSHGGPTRRFPVPSSNGINGRSGVSSPIPTWQYTQHLQQPHGKGGSPLGVNGNRSPAALTSQNLTTVSSASSVPQRPYQRSDSGSSVRESDTDSDDDGEGSSEDEEGFDPVPAPPQPTEPPPPQVVEPLRDSEQDAEAEEDDEDDEFELTNIATELEASMMIGAYYGPEVGLGAYGAAPATTEASQAAPAPKPTKSRKKAANTNPKGNATTRKAGASKAKSKAKA
ncbi:uncharacterized protein PGTG_01954 [Puccinia graminis f. sp. tritici CRL 75-36-700-3]|uniref:Uncharacterized protein n=1 Tax=Puccinia graminis f. sp. tritici (strain CRL 75-36-700-3 / race SCCL) TaxID=418459 RepID=E3JT82_PUCGT|nr:uncharacterized protein PGTG_01954 [Puccinia graminis f. sp. tritici CRL 75-36-700-3]EFP75361.1 hypothetical protein PGTG_01954 [Puccinia graminis f. sp. tritici CRL 75-36-700-3]